MKKIILSFIIGIIIGFIISFVIYINYPNKRIEHQENGQIYLITDIFGQEYITIFE